MLPELELLALWNRCPYCREIDWCRTKSGRLATDLHADRTEAIRQAYLFGYYEGIEEAAS